MGLVVVVAAITPATGYAQIDFACRGIGEPIERPAIDRLLEAIDTGNRAVVDSLTECIGGVSTPIIEPTDRPGEVHVTFVVPTGENVRSVHLDSNVNALNIDGIEEDLDTLGSMRRIPEAGIWALSLVAPADLRASYRFRVRFEDGTVEERLDPTNPDVYENEWPEQFRRSEIVLPTAIPQPWRDRDAEQGEWETHTVGGREVDAYVPPGVGADAPVIVLLDRTTFVRIIPAGRLTDELVDQRAIEPPVVLSFDLAEDGESSFYSSDIAFVADTLLAWAATRWPITQDPARVVAAGTSRRGFVATLLGLDRPEAVGKVLSLSGSFYWAPEGEEPEWMARVVAIEPVRDVEIALAVGSLETVVTHRNRGHYPLATSRHLRDVLRARGYSVVYREFTGVHEELGWQGALFLGLADLLADRAPDRFAPGVVTLDDSDELTPTLAPGGDHLVFVRRSEGGPFTLFESRLRNGAWDGPAPLAFSGEFNDQAPSFSPDGARLYFQSRRPRAPEGTSEEPSPRDDDLWFVDLRDGVWGEPRPLPEPIAKSPPPGGGEPFQGREMAPAVDREGVVYYWSHIPGQGHGQSDLYRARPEGATYTPPENLDSPVNSPHYETQPWISPEGSMLLFSCDGCPDAIGASDVYVSRWIDDRWSRPVNLGPVVNSDAYDFGARLSPDGRRLFVSSNRTSTRGERGRQNIYVVDIDRIPALRLFE